MVVEVVKAVAAEPLTQAAAAAVVVPCAAVVVVVAVRCALHRPAAARNPCAVPTAVANEPFAAAVAAKIASVA